MNFKAPRRNVESANTAKIVRRMRQLGWEMIRIGASRYQRSGLPDWYAIHKEHGSRWIEIKSYTGKLRESQKRMFKLFAEHGTGVWVMVTEDDYPCLMGKPNWWRWV